MLQYFVLTNLILEVEKKIEDTKILHRPGFSTSMLRKCEVFVNLPTSVYLTSVVIDFEVTHNSSSHIDHLER